MKRSFTVGSPTAVKRTSSNFSIFSGISDASSIHGKTEIHEKTEIELKTPVYFEIQEEENIINEVPKVITKKELQFPNNVENYEKRISKRNKSLSLTNCTHNCNIIVNKKSREKVKRKCPGNHGTGCNGLLDFACFIANHRCKACKCKCSNCII